jgi:hypothetical protein
VQREREGGREGDLVHASQGRPVLIPSLCLAVAALVPAPTASIP